MSELIFLAVEEAIPADHPVSFLAIPLGLLFLSGSVYLLLWSNYGARKAGAIYGVAFFGFAFLIGVFWWLGGPGIPQGLGVTHLPGERPDDRAASWYAFEEGSPRAEFFPGVEDLDAFESIESFTGVEDLPAEEQQDDPEFGSLVASTGEAEQDMMEQFLPVDENNVAQIGTQRRQQFEEDAEAARPDDAVGRAQPFFSAESVDEPIVREDPETGVLLAAQQFQAYATFTDADDIPLEPVEVGESEFWFAFYDPGMVWLPSALWTGIAFVLFLASLLWLDRLEMRDKRRAASEVEQPERIAEPIAQ